jgi:beta-exotoxin I transport system permease protein
MNSFVIARKTFRDNRMSTIGTSIAVIAMAVIVAALYPSYSEALKEFELPGFYQGLIGEAGDISSPEGFLSIEFFSWIPLLVITMAVIGGTRAIASEEADGTMDILLAQPVSRTRLMLEKAAGLTVAVSIMVLVAIPSLVISANVVGVDIAASKLVSGTVSMLSLVLLFLMFSLWAAAALPNRSSAVMLTVGVLIVSFFIHSLGASIESLQTARKFFPFYWTDSSAALVHGLRWGWLIWTGAVTAGLLAGAVWSFNRREIASGASDWSLRKLVPWALSPPSRHDREAEPMEEPGA